jgi:hypothetical protein
MSVSASSPACVAQTEDCVRVEHAQGTACTVEQTLAVDPKKTRNIFDAERALGHID